VIVGGELAEADDLLLNPLRESKRVASSNPRLPGI